MTVRHAHLPILIVALLTGLAPSCARDEHAAAKPSRSLSAAQFDDSMTALVNAYSAGRLSLDSAGRLLADIIEPLSGLAMSGTMSPDMQKVFEAAGRELGRRSAADEGVTLETAMVFVGAPETPRQRVTGFFSDFAYTESGDVVGAEILITIAFVNNGNDTRHYAYVQIAEGVPLEPQLVPVTVDGSQITFRLAEPFAAVSPFTGTVTSDSLIGRFTNDWELRLPRRPSYWR